MFKLAAKRRLSARGLFLAGRLAGSAAMVSTAFAAECPADKKKDDVREPVTLTAQREDPGASLRRSDQGQE